MIFLCGGHFGSVRIGGLAGQPLRVGVDVSHELVAGDGLLLEQVKRDLVEQRAVFRQ